MNILIICAGDRLDNSIALSCIKYIHKLKKDRLTLCVLDNNKEILKFASKHKIKFVNKKIDYFFSRVKKNEFDWLLNVWGHKILKKDFLLKFKNNVNLHPSYLPYNRGRDPYYFSIINRTPIGVCIHKMDKTVDGGKYYLRKKIIINFPMTAGEIFENSLHEIKKLFLKNWVNIRNKKIKLKNFELINKVNKRKTFIKKNFIILDDKKNKREKNFVLNCLAQDFSFLKQQVKLYGKIYNCKLILSPSIKKKW